MRGRLIQGRRWLGAFVLALCGAVLMAGPARATTWEDLVKHLRPAPAKAKIAEPKGKGTQAEPAAEPLARSIAKLYQKSNKTLSEQQALVIAKATVEKSRHRNIDPGIMAGIVVVESRANVKARNKSMLGLTQVHWGVHKKSIQKSYPHIKKPADMLDVENNLTVGTRIFAGYVEKAGGDVKKALTYYLGRRNTAYIRRVLGYRDQVYKGL